MSQGSHRATTEFRRRGFAYPWRAVCPCGWTGEWTVDDVNASFDAGCHVMEKGECHDDECVAKHDLVWGIKVHAQGKEAV